MGVWRQDLAGAESEKTGEITMNGKKKMNWMRRAATGLVWVMLAALLLAGCAGKEPAEGTPEPSTAAAQEPSTAIAQEQSVETLEEMSDAASEEASDAASEEASVTDAPEQDAADLEESDAVESPEASTEEISEDGTYSSKDEVALYLHTYGHLPDNYITKKEAESLGWNSKKGNLWEVAPGKSIGGSHFGNYEGQLPEKKGRKYYECDLDYDGGYRGAKRLIYSNDGLVFYTEDHYKTFEQLY